MNRNKIILDLCGGTGAWSRPYVQHGYDVRLITLPEYDVLTYKIPDEPVYGILAAPPCTVFSLAAWKIPIPEKNFMEGVKIVSACLRIIHECQARGLSVKFWALENPVGYLRKFLGKPAFTFQGWWFGEAGALRTKRTDIWGYFNSPKIIIHIRPDAIKPSRHSSLEWQTPPHPKWYQGKKLSRADRRAITPAGFAQRFYEANK